MPFRICIDNGTVAGKPCADQVKLASPHVVVLEGGLNDKEYEAGVGVGEEVEDKGGVMEEDAFWPDEVREDGIVEVGVGVDDETDVSSDSSPPPGTPCLPCTPDKITVVRNNVRIWKGLRQHDTFLV